MSVRRKLASIAVLMAGSMFLPAFGGATAWASSAESTDGHIVGPHRVNYGPIDYPAGSTCQFAVHQAPVIDQVMVIQYYDDSDRLVKEFYYGKLVDDVTNTETGKSIRVDLSGSAIVAYAADGTTTIYGVGPYSVGLHPGDTPGPFLARVDGLSKVTIAPTGVKHVDFASRIENLCTAIA